MTFGRCSHASNGYKKKNHKFESLVNPKFQPKPEIAHLPPIIYGHYTCTHAAHMGTYTHTTAIWGYIHTYNDTCTHIPPTWVHTHIHTRANTLERKLVHKKIRKNGINKQKKK
jgi:hypothetical protein